MASAKLIKLSKVSRMLKAAQAINSSLGGTTAAQKFYAQAPLAYQRATAAGNTQAMMRAIKGAGLRQESSAVQPETEE